MLLILSKISTQSCSYSLDNPVEMFYFALIIPTFLFGSLSSNCIYAQAGGSKRHVSINIRAHDVNTGGILYGFILR